MLCPQCCAEIPNSSKVCPQCGTAQPARRIDEGDNTEILSEVLIDTVPSQGLATELLDGEALQPEGEAPITAVPQTTVAPTEQQAIPINPLEDTAPRDPVVMPMIGYNSSDSALQDKPKKKHRGLIATVVLLLVAAAVGGAFFVLRPLFDAVTVPELAGQGRAEAVRLIEEAGLVPELSELAADDNFDTVINSSPVGGTTVDRGSKVTIIIAIPRIMPKLHGLSLEEANKLLSDVGATNIVTAYRHSSEPEGTIISATPAEGAQFRSTDEVQLVVSKPYTVPELVGIGRDEAIRLIKEAELTAKVEQVESEDKAGTVLSSDPVAGTRMSRGQTVVITVAAAGPREETYLPDYIREDPSDVNEYLQWKGWTYAGSGFGALTSANERWTKTGVGSLLFTPTPANGDYIGIGLSGSTSMGSEVEGVRFEPELSGSFEGAALTEAYLQQCAYRCGLGELTEFVSNESIIRPRQESGFGFDLGQVSDLWDFDRTSESESSAEGSAETNIQDSELRRGAEGGPAFLAGVAEGETLYWYVSVTADANGNPELLTLAVGKRVNLADAPLESYGNSLASYLASIDHFGD